QWAGYVLLRLPYAVKDLFQTWLQEHRPLEKNKILHRIREVRGGKLYDATWGSRMRGEGVYAEQIRDLFKAMRRKCGYPEKSSGLSIASFRRDGGRQPELFDV